MLPVTPRQFADSLHQIAGLDSENVTKGPVLLKVMTKDGGAGAGLKPML
jgi:hypothetical protein